MDVCRPEQVDLDTCWDSYPRSGLRNQTEPEPREGTDGEVTVMAKLEVAITLSEKMVQERAEAISQMLSGQDGYVRITLNDGTMIAIGLKDGKATRLED